jgi:hypothetical protein
MSMIMIYESRGQFQRMMETLNLANWLSDKYIFGLDEIKKLVVKLTVMGKNRLDVYFYELNELTKIA